MYRYIHLLMHNYSLIQLFLFEKPNKKIQGGSVDTSSPTSVKIDIDYVTRVGTSMST